MEYSHMKKIGLFFAKLVFSAVGLFVIFWIFSDKKSPFPESIPAQPKQLEQRSLSMPQLEDQIRNNLRIREDATAALPSTPASNGVFKCFESGKTIYSQQPCSPNAQIVPDMVTSSASPITGTPGALTLNTVGNGIFTVPGTIQGIPVTFQIDTGASDVTISQRVADMAGLKNCSSYKDYVTANGNIRNCVTSASTMTFGHFRMNDVAVNISSNMTQDALLGMAVLSKLKIEQHAGVMVISLQ
jgi:aspartyl protease family protein